MVRKYLQHDCSRFLAYVVDILEEKNRLVSDVPVVCEFLDFFPNELPGLPPNRHIEFMIYLITSVSLIAKALYHLALPEMHELA